MTLDIGSPSKTGREKGSPNRVKIERNAKLVEASERVYQLRTALPCHGGLRRFFRAFAAVSGVAIIDRGGSSAVVPTLFKRRLAARPASVSLGGVLTPRF
jgi:hypothetical protein